MSLRDLWIRFGDLRATARHPQAASSCIQRRAALLGANIAEKKSEDMRYETDLEITMQICMSQVPQWQKSDFVIPD
jgi:hypothetical protein